MSKLVRVEAGQEAKRKGTGKDNREADVFMVSMESRDDRPVATPTEHLSRGQVKVCREEKNVKEGEGEEAKEGGGDG